MNPFTEQKRQQTSYIGEGLPKMRPKRVYFGTFCIVLALFEEFTLIYRSNAQIVCPIVQIPILIENFA